MNLKKNLVTLVMGSMLSLGLTQKAEAGWLTPDKVTWKKSPIVVYTDTLPSPALDYVKMGIQMVANQLEDVDVTFVDGNAPASAENYVQISKQDVVKVNNEICTGEGKPIYDSYHPELGIVKGEIIIDTQALTIDSGYYEESYGAPNKLTSEDYVSFQKFLTTTGAHEFMHVLGLEDYNSSLCVMNHEIDVINPVYGLTSTDLDLLEERYTIVPEPFALFSLTLGSLALLKRKF